MTNAAALSAHSDLAGFYARPAVRDRIVDFLGARHASSAVAGYGGGRWLRQPGDGAVSLSWDALATLFDEGADVLRSLGDREGTLLVLDLDYVHPADPAETVREPMRCFALLEPAHHAVLAEFARLGIEPLVLMTLAGYQYLARAPLAGRLHAGLLEAGGASDWAAGSTNPADVRAHRGAGRLLQLVVHRTLRDIARAAPLPVRVADIAPAGGGPFIRLELGAYADGADLQHVRCAFSSDQTPLVTRPGAAVPFVVVLPRGDRGYRDLMALRTDLEAAALYAQSASSCIPDVVDGADGVREYERSTLAAFHREMDHAPAAAEWAHRPSGLGTRSRFRRASERCCAPEPRAPAAAPPADDGARAVERRLASAHHRRAGARALRGAARLGQHLLGAATTARRARSSSCACSARPRPKGSRTAAPSAARPWRITGCVRRTAAGTTWASCSAACASCR
jgi:hypothetical protein